MLRIALDLSGSSVLDSYEDAASIGTVVRARGMDNLFHDSFDYTWVLLGSDSGLHATPVQKKRAAFAARRGLSVLFYCCGGRTRTRPATTTGFSVVESLKTRPRAIKFGVPATARPANPLMFSKVVEFPVSTVNAPPAE